MSSELVWVREEFLVQCVVEGFPGHTEVVNVQATIAAYQLAIVWVYRRSDLMRPMNWLPASSMNDADRPGTTGYEPNTSIAIGLTNQLVVQEDQLDLEFLFHRISHALPSGIDEHASCPHLRIVQVAPPDYPAGTYMDSAESHTLNPRPHSLA